MTNQKHTDEVKQALATGGPLPEGTRLDFSNQYEPIQQVTTKDLAAEEKAVADAEKEAIDAAKKAAGA